jgi:hypothetical protein
MCVMPVLHFSPGPTDVENISALFSSVDSQFTQVDLGNNFPN